MLNLKLNLLKNEVVIDRGNSDEEIRLFLGDPQMPNTQIQLNLDLPEIYKVSRVHLNGSNRVYTPCHIKEGGNPFVFCRKNPLWTPDSYERGISNLMLNPKEILILYLGKRGKIGKDIQVNVFAPAFESLGYEILQDFDALKYEETKQLREIVDYKILERLRGAA